MLGVTEGKFFVCVKFEMMASVYHIVPRRRKHSDLILFTSKANVHKRCLMHRAATETHYKSFVHSEKLCVFRTQSQF